MRVLWLVGFAMVMFTAGVFVQFSAQDASDHVLGGVAILGAFAVIVANVDGKQQ